MKYYRVDRRVLGVMSNTKDTLDDMSKVSTFSTFISLLFANNVSLSLIIAAFAFASALLRSVLSKVISGCVVINPLEEVTALPQDERPDPEPIQL